MIFFLLKRDAMFKTGLACTLITPMVVLLNRDAGIAVVSAICFLGYLSAICTLRPRATHFEIGLPIAGKQLFLSRVFLQRQFPQSEMTNPMRPNWERFSSGRAS